MQNLLLTEQMAHSAAIVLGSKQIRTYERGRSDGGSVDICMFGPTTAKNTRGQQLGFCE